MLLQWQIFTKLLSNSDAETAYRMLGGKQLIPYVKRDYDYIN